VIQSIIWTAGCGVVAAAASMLPAAMLVSRELVFADISAVGGAVIGLVAGGWALTGQAARWHLGRLPARRQPSGESSLTHSVRAAASLWTIRGIRLRVFRWIASWPESGWRGMAMLTSRELGAALPCFLIWGGLGVALLLLCHWIRAATLIAPAAGLVAGGLMIFGHLSISNDRRSSALSLLAQRGVSPRRIWLVKTVVWFGLAVAGTGICFQAADAAHRATASGRRVINWTVLDTNVTGDGPFLLDLPDPRHHALAAMAAELRQAGIVAIVVGLFSIGQISACWIRSRVISLTLAGVGIFFWSILTLWLVRWDWSLWRTLIPLAVVLLIAAALTSRSWLDGRAGWRVTSRRLAAPIAAGVIAVIAGYLGWWMQPSRAFDTHGPAMLSRSLPVPSGGFEPGIESPQGPASGNLEWQNFARLMESSERSSWPRGQSPVVPLVQFDAISNHSVTLRTLQDHRLAEATLDELLAVLDPLISRERTAIETPMAWRLPTSISPSGVITVILLQDAKRRLEQQDLDGAIERTTSAIRVCQSLIQQTSSWSNWLLCLQAEDVALEYLRELLQSPELTEQQIARIEQAVQLSSAARPNPRHMLAERSKHWALLRLGVSPLTPSDNAVTIYDTFAGTTRSQLASAQNQSWFDRMQTARALQWMRFSELMLLQVPLDDRAMAAFIGQDPRMQWFDAARADLLRGLETSPYVDQEMDIRILITPSSNPIMGSIVSTVTARRITELVMRLQRHRLRHVEFPDSLSELASATELNPQYLIDPNTGAMFGYDPGIRRNSGTPVDESTGDANWSPPILWTVNSIFPEVISGQLLRQVQQIRDSAAAADSSPGRIIVLGLRIREGESFGPGIQLTR
jgi:hypothetical protein